MMETKTEEGSDAFGPVSKLPLRGVRKAIASAMMNSLQKSAQTTLFDAADVTDFLLFREKEKENFRKKGIHVTVTPYIIKAIVDALKKHPYANATVDDEKQEIILKNYYNIGVAVDTPAGLMVPVLNNADKKSIEQIAKEVAELGEKARNRKLGLQDFKGGTFTLSNLGAIGSTYATPILNYPEVAILVTGKVGDKAVVKDAKIAARKVLPLSFSFDHRVIDGAQGARFLMDLKKVLESVEELKKII